MFPAVLLVAVEAAGSVETRHRETGQEILMTPRSTMQELEVTD